MLKKNQKKFVKKNIRKSRNFGGLDATNDLVESEWQGNAQLGQKDNYVHTCLLKLATMTKGLFTFQEVIVNIRLLQTFFSNSLYYLSLYRNEDEKISSSSTNSSSSRPRVERSSSTRIANAAKLLRQHLRYLYLSKICIKYCKHGRSSLANFYPKIYN